MGGTSFAERLAVKSNRFREESQFWVFIGETDKSAVRVYPQGKAYDAMQPPRGNASASGIPYPKLLASQPDVVFTALGTIQISGHKCIKIEVGQEGKPTKIYFYAALDFKNLVIESRLVSPRRQVTQRMSNISLDVPEDLVQIPSDYVEIVHDRWTKVESAKVTYNGKPSNDFGVFRAPGGELFIWIQDAYYPWDYLVRPHEQTVEIAFQGLLVNRTGDYIWRTTGTEAFSLANYRVPNDKSHAEHAEVTSNSVTFRSFSYDEDKATIEVSW